MPIDSQSTEETQLNDAGLALLKFRELQQCFIECDQLCSRARAIAIASFNSNFCAPPLRL